MNHFFDLSPDRVLQAIEKQGYLTTGELYQLNSYENRVFNIRLEQTSADTPAQVIAKFYRPGRWSLPALQEEHSFLQELAQEGIEVVPAMTLANHKTIDVIDGPIYFSLFPKKLGRMPEEFLPGEWQRLGRTLARLHNVGAQKTFQHRPTMGTAQHLGWKSLALLEKWITPEMWPRYEKAASHILEFLEETLPDTQFLRIHGDCHRGNVLSDGQGFFFVDFDDCLNGPAVQDLWMLLPGAVEDCDKELGEFLKGYEEFRDFDDEELELIPALRGLRIFSYAAWIAQRWNDPSFPRLFPQFNTYIYWAEEVESLERLAWSI